MATTAAAAPAPAANIEVLGAGNGDDIVRKAIPHRTTALPLVLEIREELDGRVPVVLCCPADAARAPVVFFHHGSRGDAIGQLFMGIPLAEAGFFTVLMDARHHGRRKDVDFDRFFAPEAYNEHYLDLLLGTCEDMSALIDLYGSDPRADISRIGVSGISQGAFVSFMAVARDKRIKAAAPIIGSPDLELPFGAARPTEELAPDLRGRIAAANPLRAYALMPPTALLIQNGDSDTVVPVEGVRKLDRLLRPLYAALPGAYEYIEYAGQGHSDKVEGADDPLVMRRRAIAWLSRHL